MLIAVLAVTSHHRPRKIRQRQRVNDGTRITLDQSLRHFLTTNFGSRIATGRKYRDPLLSVVSVGGQHVDGFVLQQPQSAAADAFTPESSERGASHRNDATLFGPLDHPLRTLAKNRIAFGMRDHRRHAAVA